MDTEIQIVLPEATEIRSEKISVSLSPSLLADLNAYARAHHWARSTAIMVLVQEGLRREQGE